MDAASHAIMLQADQILVKPMNVTALVGAIRERLSIGPPALRVVETVAAILNALPRSPSKTGGSCPAG